MIGNKVIAPGTIGMLQAAGERINTCGISKRLLCHPAAGFGMDHTTFIADP